MRMMRWAVMAVLLCFLSAPAAAEQPEVLLGVALDFEKAQITLQVASSGCTRKEDFRFEFSNSVLTVIRKERDSCKAMPSKVDFTYPLKAIGINPHTPFKISNAFVANERLAQ